MTRPANYKIIMKKETLTVNTDEYGTITYRNASGQLHHQNGPAVIWPDGGKDYYINGKLHNPNGPAILYADGSKSYYINGKRLTESEFTAWQAQQVADTQQA